MFVAVFIALCVKVRAKNSFTRAGFGWIVAGYGVGVVIGLVGLSVLLDFVDSDSRWPRVGQLVVMLAMPASVAYSLIRHRSFGLGYVTNRMLVFASLTIAAVSTFSIVVWVTSGHLSSTLGVGTAMFVALLVGMVFQAQHGARFGSSTASSYRIATKPGYRSIACGRHCVERTTRNA